MTKASTQRFLEIDQIREGLVILKNKTLRGILMVSSLNFALKSADEQNATIYQYQNFLNSLEFPLEIIIQSRRLNLTGYFDKLKELEKAQKNELLKAQTAEYRKFIESLVIGGTIMSKNFYAVVPYSLMEEQLAKPTGFLGDLFKKPQIIPEMTEEKFQRCKSQLWQRIEFIAFNLRRCGLKCVPLNTTELIELFWSIHHPEEAESGYFPQLPPELLESEEQNN